MLASDRYNTGKLAVFRIYLPSLTRWNPGQIHIKNAKDYLVFKNIDIRVVNDRVNCYFTK